MQPANRNEVFAAVCEAELRWLNSDKVRDGDWFLVGGEVFKGYFMEAKPRLIKLVEAANGLDDVRTPPVTRDDITYEKMKFRDNAVTFVKRILEWTRSLAPESAPPDEPSNVTHSLTVDFARKTLRLDGATMDVPSENALRWVKVLAEHSGEWISGPQLEKYDPQLTGVRTHAIREYLPQAVLDLIDSETGKGSRLRLESA